jgi:Raf kinase inhibitor-like YbhB/YbcL family protein
MRAVQSRALGVLVVVAALAGCGSDNPAPPSDAGPSAIVVTSSAFADGDPIPDRFTCQGAGAAPPLAWTGVPPSTAALALVVVDPDAGDYYHWVALDLPASSTSLSGRATVEARNSHGSTGWTPPCPPSGTHHYRFTVYALDAPTGLADGTATGPAVDAIAKHAIAHGTLTGTVSSSSG